MHIWKQLLKTYLVYGALLGLLFGGIYFYIQFFIMALLYWGGTLPPILGVAYMIFASVGQIITITVEYLPLTLTLGVIIGALFAIWNWLFVVLLLNKRSMPEPLYKYASGIFSYLSTFAATVIFTALFNQFLDESFNNFFSTTVYTLAVGGVFGLLPAMLNKQLVMKYHSQYIAKVKSKRIKA
ncbi:MAG: hypothetical protein D6712_02290 [Chloroflexi bacterium]|nr:MAG: hypothetical protein D6712_02290 [Chloroflexota bacterium]